MGQADSGPAGGAGENRRVSPPYEAVVNTAVKKLTDEILLFLLAYTILLIGVALFGSNLTATMRTLLYLIPLLGVAAHVWMRRPGAGRAAGRHVRVRSAIAAGRSYVGGERGTGQGSGGTDVGSLFAGGGSTVVGRDAGGRDADEAPATARTEYLLDLFRQLDTPGQMKLVESAQTLLEQQLNRNG
jgi:hypothetical protein